MVRHKHFVWSILSNFLKLMWHFCYNVSCWNFSNRLPTAFPDCNQVQSSELLPWVIFTQILRICTQKNCILLSSYATSTSIWALITSNSYFYNFQGFVVSKLVTGSSQSRCVISRHTCTIISKQIETKQLAINSTIVRAQTQALTIKMQL